MSMRERIASGLLFTDMQDGLPDDRLRGKELCWELNHLRPSETERRLELIGQLFGEVGEGVWLEPPVHVSYGSNVTLGDGVYINTNVTFTDDYRITIGNGVLLAPNVAITTTGHPVHPDLRPEGQMFALPVVIEDNVWIGTGAIILPGVTIGRNSVIGAGSVVTKDVPPDVVAGGDPRGGVRPVTGEDRGGDTKGRRVAGELPGW